MITLSIFYALVMTGLQSIPLLDFFVFNMWMRHTALTNGNVFVNMDSELSKMNVAQLKEHIKENPSVLKQLMFMGSNIRGSKAYWKSRCGELRDMVEQIGLPTMFLTLSAADLYWPDLYRLLTGKDIADINMRERRKLLQENPLIVDMFFQYRLQCYIEHVLVPKYEVTDYWYRIEYQHRGSPHVHGLFWLKGAPDVSNYVDKSEDEKKHILKYFDELVWAVNPREDCPMPDKHPCESLFEGVVDVEMDLAQLLKKVQRHTKCSPDYCQRVNRKTKMKTCRFKFPIDIELCSQLHVNEESAEVQFIPERNDSRLNKYNPFIIATWRANIDVAPVLSKKAIIEYLSKYVSKSEIGSQTLSEICTNVCGALNGNDKAKRAIHKILIKNCVERDISAQEVCHILMGSKLFCSGGRNFVVVYTNRSKWTPLDVDEDEAHDNTSRGQSFMEKYAGRPSHLHSLSMWDIAKQYNPRSWSKSKKLNIVRVFPRLFLSANEEKNEGFYRQKVLLFVPWTKETEDKLKTGNESWRDVYDRHGVAHLKVSEVDINITGRFDQADEHENVDVSHNDVANEDWMIASRLCGRRCVEGVELGMRQLDLAHDWRAHSKNYESYGDIKYFQSFIENEKKKDTDSFEFSELPNVTFSMEQDKVKNLMEKQCQAFRNGDFSSTPKRVLVQGKAGTGKSLLIKFLADKLFKEFGSGSFLLLGPTGVSAINIAGSTVHSVLKIPTKKSQFKPLKGRSARKFSSMMENVKFIIVDEYSMIGCTLLGMIDKRLREGTGVNEPFGSLNMYFFGDCKQLPPVKDVSLYGGVCKNDLAQHGKNMFDSFECHYVLTKGHRQNDPIFQELLDRLSVGDVTLDDYNLLKSRFSTKVTKNEENSFDDAIHLFSTKDEVHHYNDLKLLKMKDRDGNLVPIARIPAKHHGNRASTASTEKANGLESVLYLARGTQIMLRSNLWVKKGLVNGAMGSVIDLLYEDGMEPPNDAPSVLMCKFDNYNGPGIGPENLVPIVPVVRTYSQNEGVQCSRQQFPIVVCYGCSIHKSQGLTLNKAVIDIGPKEFALGLSYVALSRVKTLNGLLLKPFTYQRLLLMKSKPEMLLRRSFEDRVFNL